LAIGEEEINLFKPLLKDIPVFCDLPSNFKNEVLKLMADFRDVNKGEQVISSVQQFPDIYILFKGYLKFSKYSLGQLEKEEEERKCSDFFYIKENFREEGPIQVFGGLDALTANSKDKWKQQFVYALENSSIITFNYKDVKNKIIELTKQSTKTEDQEFLRK
jgi:hypothetical protein